MARSDDRAHQGGMPLAREALIRRIAWVPVLVVVAVVVVAIGTRPSAMSTAITDQVRVRLVFVTHPRCPECRP